MSDYKKLDDKEDIVGGTFGQPIRNSKLINTKMMKSKLNGSLDKAIAVLTNALNDDKKAYTAAKDVLAFYLQLANLEMREESHREEMKFKRHKNKMAELEFEEKEKQNMIGEVGGTADIPQAKFSMDLEDTNWS